MRKPGCTPVLLPPETIQPVERRARSTRSGPLAISAAAHVLPADAIGEPARVGHFVDRVDVERANVAPLSGMPERVDDEVVAVRVLDRHDLRRVQRRGRRRSRADRRDRSAARPTVAGRRRRRRAGRRHRQWPRAAGPNASRGRTPPPLENAANDDIQVIAITAPERRHPRGR